MGEVTFDIAVDRIVAKDTRYAPEAYHFLRDALAHTQQSLRRPNEGECGHVSGQELLIGIRDFALEQFGPMTCCVLDEWGIRSCEDFGEMVFNLVGEHQFRTTDRDSREDFKGGYDFQQTFCRPFRPGCDTSK
jgi:uncharacterized repeat protein (TIGR04138 family)